MFGAGFGLNILSILILTGLLYVIGVPAFGIGLDSLPDWVSQ